MITVMKSLLIFVASISGDALNPVKLTVILLIFSSTALIFMSMYSAMTWFPLIFYMLFMGGILLMFMILSSGMPNEKAMKFKAKWALVLTTMYLTVENPSTADTSILGTKSSMSSHHSMIFLTGIIMIYFFYFLKIISGEKMSMRTLLCFCGKTCKLSELKSLLNFCKFESKKDS